MVTYRTLHGHTFSFLLGKHLKVEKWGGGCGKKAQEGGIYVHMSYFAVQQKLAQHSEAIICQLKKIFFNTSFEKKWKN